MTLTWGCHRIYATKPTLSKNNRERYGLLKLTTGKSHEEVPEELSLFQVLSLLPRPLNKNLLESPEWYGPLMEKITLSLNEGYGLLRSCGLPPQEFWERLSIGHLRRLKDLVKLAKKLSLEDSGVALSAYEIYKRSFKQLMLKQTVFSDDAQQEEEKCRGFAGFDCFEDFASSEVGRKLLNEQLDNIDDLEQLYPSTNSVIDDIEMEDYLKQILAKEADTGKLSPVIEYYFEKTLIEQEHILGHDSFFNSVIFRNLVETDEMYAQLDDETLNNELFDNIKEILKRHKP